MNPNLQGLPQEFSPAGTDLDELKRYFTSLGLEIPDNIEELGIAVDYSDDLLVSGLGRQSDTTD